jgi:hypothetical protein
MFEFLRKAGGIIKRVGDVASAGIRRFGEPLAAAAKPLAQTVQGFVGDKGVAGTLVKGVSKGLDYVSSGKAAAAADRIGKWGAGLGT